MEPNNNINPTPTPNPVPNTNSAGNPAVGPATEPVISPAVNSVANPTPVQVTAAGGITETPVNPIITPTGTNKINATEPILRPEPAPAPDPVKEELSAPMVAAAPMPGSIGSAVSGPAASNPANADMAESMGGMGETEPATGGFMNERRTPSVAFNDPATQPDPATQAPAPAKAPAKKSSKPVLITLIVVALAIVAVLVAMLVMQLTSDNTGSTSAANTPTTVDVDDNEEEAKDAADADSDAADDDTDASQVMTVACYRAMTATELANYANAVSGTVNMESTYDEEDTLIQVKKTEVVMHADSADPSEEKSLVALASELTAETAAEYYLPVDKENSIDLNLGGIKTNWMELGFTCE